MYRTWVADVDLWISGSEMKTPSHFTCRKEDPTESGDIITSFFYTFACCCKHQPMWEKALDCKYSLEVSGDYWSTLANIAECEDLEGDQALEEELFTRQHSKQSRFQCTSLPDASSSTTWASAVPQCTSIGIKLAIQFLRSRGQIPAHWRLKAIMALAARRSQSLVAKKSSIQRKIGF